MKASELIRRLSEIVYEDGDLDVWIDSENEIEFGEIRNVVGKTYSGRPSNHNPHIYILSDVKRWENNL